MRIESSLIKNFISFLLLFRPFLNDSFYNESFVQDIQAFPLLAISKCFTAICLNGILMVFSLNNSLNWSKVQPFLPSLILMHFLFDAVFLCLPLNKNNYIEFAKEYQFSSFISFIYIKVIGILSWFLCFDFNFYK